MLIKCCCAFTNKYCCYSSFQQKIINCKNNFYNKTPLLIAAGVNPKICDKQQKNTYDYIKSLFKTNQLQAKKLCDFVYNLVEVRKSAFAATKRGNLTCLQQIVKLYPEMVNATDQNGNCLLHYAVNLQNNDFKITKFLMSKGAWLDRKNKDGISPFVLAYEQEKKELVFMMLPFIAPKEIDYQMQKKYRMIPFICMIYSNIINKNKLKY